MHERCKDCCKAFLFRLTIIVRDGQTGTIAFSKVFIRVFYVFVDKMLLAYGNNGAFERKSPFGFSYDNPAFV